MRKTNLRGGNDYKINEILGKNFKDFVSLLRGNDLSRFTFEAYGDKSATSSGLNNPKPKDLHYDFSQYVMAASAAFREIENPDIEKATVSPQYANDLNKMYDEIVNMETGSGTTGGIINPEKFSFEFKALPYYKGKNVKINYLSSVFHFLPYTDKIFENYDDSSYGGLVNAIRYIYHFLSILDLDNVNVKDVMVLLRTDNAGFISYVDQIVDTLSSSIYFTNESRLPSEDVESKSLIREGVINGLTAIAEEIINELRNIPTNPGILPTRFEDIRTLGAPAPGNYQDFMKKMGVDDANAINISKKYFAVFPGKDFYKAGADASKAVPDETQRKTYAFNSLMNPYYLSDTFKKSIDANDITGSLVQKGGLAKVAPRARPAAAANALVSLPFLYGPSSTGANPKRYLTTEPTQGDTVANANLVDSVRVAGIKSYIDEINNFGTYRDNGVRIILLSLATYMIENNKSSAQLADDGNEIYEYMKKNLLAYNKFYTRIRKMGNVAEILGRYRDSFVSEFVNMTYRDYQFADGKLELKRPLAPSRTYLDPKKSNLTDPTIGKFYTNIVASDPKFYSEFFNLVRLGDVGTFKGYAGDVPLEEAKSLSTTDLAKYRLNVKKNTGYTRLHNLQVGGVNGSYGDIVFVSLIPDYPTDGSVGDIWLSRTYKVPQSEITREGTDVVRSIARIVYSSSPAGTGTVNVLGENVNIIDLVRRVGTTGFFLKNYPDFLKNYLRSLATESPIASRSTWKEGELLISEHMLKEGNTWQRQGDHFVKLDKNGKEIDNVPIEDNCTFINDTRGCLDFLTECLPANSESDYNAFCGKLLDFDFKTNMGMKVLAEQVQKIDPQVAFAILRKLRFGSYLAEETIDPPVKGFRRYKVQSVGSWLEELMTGAPKDRCKKYAAPTNTDFDCGPLKDQLGALADTIIKMAQDPKKYNFFNYLDILVHWVNANPQVLNPEEIEGVVTKHFYPSICKGYRTYNYVDPYKPAEIRLRGMSCGLDRLKSSIMNELSGANASATISTIASVPLGIEMPLSRYGFTNPIPFGGLTPMTGGQLYEIDSELDKWNQAYGHELFESIFRDLYNTMGNMVGKRGMRLSNKTNRNIEDKLSRFKETEEALRKSLKNLIERNKIYQASRGHIDAFELDDAQLAAVLEKHSNLLALGSAYNKKAVNLIDLFQTITKAILNKVDEGSSIKSDSQKSKYERPLSMDFHYQNSKKN